MGAIRQLVDELRRRGVTVHEWPGWDGRGNADGGIGPRVTQIEPVGAVIHHTGSPYGSAYAGLVSSTRPELLGGCLCNFAGNEDGSLTVIASGLAWHAGAGVGPSLGRALGKIPNVRNRMNRLTVGLEIVYPGAAPMRPAQYRTACVFAAAVADLFGGGELECVRAHAETNGNVPGGSGKWDPGCLPGRTIDMAAFRRDAAQLQTAGDWFAMATKEDLVSVLRSEGISGAGDTGRLQQAIRAMLPEIGRAVLCLVPEDREGVWAWDRLAHIEELAQSIADKIGGGLSGGSGGDISRDDVKAAVQEALREGTGAPANPAS